MPLLKMIQNSLKTDSIKMRAFGTMNWLYSP